TPALRFVRPFRCPVTILNTKDHLGSGPNWLFDTDALTKSINYKPIIMGNQSNGNAGTKTCDDAVSQDNGFQPLSDDGRKVDEDPRQESKCKDQEKEDYVNNTNNVNAAGTNRVNIVGANTNNELTFDPEMPELEDIRIFNFLKEDEDDGAEADMNNLDTAIQVSPTLTIRIYKDRPLDKVIGDCHSTTQTRNISKNLEEHRNKKDERGIVIRNKPRLVAQGRTQEEEIYYDEDPDFPDKMYKVEKALYGLHQAPRAWYETLLTYLLDNGFHRGEIYKTLFIRRHKDDILLVQVYVDDIIFGSPKKELCNAFEKMMHENFK
nr:hypothetical protein [Tanacetum cinerariifolium]